MMYSRCFAGDPGSWEFTHRCASAWAYIRPTIVTDTHAAYAAWSSEHNHPLPTYAPGDVVIQSRCARDTVLSHSEYGPVAFSFYDNIPATTTQIYIVTELVGRSEVCEALHLAQEKYIKRAFPQANITVVGTTPHEDFGRLLYAPLLFKDAASSFGLWAAVANKGQVWSTPLMDYFSAHNLTPYLGQNWHWSSAPVLYPSVAARFNLTLDNLGAVLAWLEAH